MENPKYVTEKRYVYACIKRVRRKTVENTALESTLTKLKWQQNYKNLLYSVKAKLNEKLIEYSY